MGIVVGVVVISVSGRVEATIPGLAVPQSAQTLAVLVVGSLLGAKNGALTLSAYLVLGGIGLPLFAGGSSGWVHLMGPSAGYLAGFVVAAAAAGRLADRGLLRRLGPAFAAMLAGHALILALGWMRLALMLGVATAFEEGVAPFVVGGILKSVVAALAVVIVTECRGA